MKFQPIIALFTGLACIFLLRRGFEYIPFAVVSIIFVVFYILLRFYLLKKKVNSMITSLSDFAVTFSLSNILLFILPFYLESITIYSRNMAFGLLIIILTIIFNWYHIYNKYVLNRPLWGSIILAFAFFSIFNFIFPIIFGMRNIWSLLLSGAISGIVVFVLVYPHIPILKNTKNTLKIISGIALTLVALWFGRSLIPPAPLKLTKATACEAIEAFRPVNPFVKTKIDNDREVFFYSSIFAPMGLKEGIRHIWYHEGKRLLSIGVSEITGGRKEGFGTWSWHVLREGEGKYTVEVWTRGGQLLGKKDFYIEINQEELEINDEIYY